MTKSTSKLPKWAKHLIAWSTVVIAITIVIPFLFEVLKPLNDLKVGIENANKVPLLEERIENLEFDMSCSDEPELTEEQFNSLVKRFEADSVDFDNHLYQYYLLKDKVNRNH